MTIEEFCKLKIGDKLLYRGMILIIQCVYTNKYNNCLDVYLLHEGSETDGEYAFCSVTSKETIQTELTKINL